MRFSKDSECFGFLDAAEKDAEYRSALGKRQGTDGCMYEGVHWLVEPAGRDRTGTYVRFRPDYNPDSSRLRVTRNETSMITQKSAASTHPDEISMDVAPGERDMSSDGHYRARVHETFVNAMIGCCGYLRAAQAANFRRAVFGTRGLGLALVNGTYRVNGQDIESRYLRAFEFDAVNLLLDPACQNLDLHEHPFVVYSDVWTVERANRAYGLKLKPEDCKTVEQLEPQKIEINALSNNKLFTKYARMAQTKAVRVSQVHLRDGFGRFPWWYVVVEDGNRNKTLVNKDSDECPFGGVGLPFMLLHGYHRADTMWSWGEPAQIKEDQDKMNLLETQKFRVIQQFSSPKYIVDRKAFPREVTDEAIHEMFNNQVGGVVPFASTDRTRPVTPPYILQPPNPPSFLSNEGESYRQSAREKAHKAPGNFGVEKSHVPFQTTARVLDDADQVASVRVAEDTSAHLFLIGVLHSTALRLFQDREPAVLAECDHAGMDAQDYAVLAEADPDTPKVELSVKQSSIRHRSHASKKADLVEAAQLQMIGPEDYQRGMADTLDTPLLEEHRQMDGKLTRIVRGIVYGDEWQGEPLGRWSATFIEKATQSLVEPRVRADAAARDRLVRAIVTQQGIQQQEALMANPELAAKVASAGGGTSGGAAQEPDTTAQAVSVGDVLDALSQGGPASVGAEPAAAA